MLVCYARELKEHFVEYAEQTVRLMVPMLKFYFHDGVRAAAAESLPYLLECAKIRGPQYVQEMWAHISPELLKVCAKANEKYIYGSVLVNPYFMSFFSRTVRYRIFLSFKGNRSRT